MREVTHAASFIVGSIGWRKIAHVSSLLGGCDIRPWGQCRQGRTHACLPKGHGISGGCVTTGRGGAAAGLRVRCRQRCRAVGRRDVSASRRPRARRNRVRRGGRIVPVAPAGPWDSRRPGGLAVANRDKSRPVASSASGSGARRGQGLSCARKNPVAQWSAVSPRAVLPARQGPGSVCSGFSRKPELRRGGRIVNAGCFENDDVDGLCLCSGIV